MVPVLQNTYAAMRDAQPHVIQRYDAPEKTRPRLRGLEKRISPSKMFSKPVLEKAIETSLADKEMHRKISYAFVISSATT